MSIFTQDDQVLLMGGGGDSSAGYINFPNAILYKDDNTYTKYSATKDITYNDSRVSNFFGSANPFFSIVYYIEDGDTADLTAELSATAFKAEMYPYATYTTLDTTFGGLKLIMLVRFLSESFDVTTKNITTIQSVSAAYTVNIRMISLSRAAPTEASELTVVSEQANDAELISFYTAANTIYGAEARFYFTCGSTPVSEIEAGLSGSFQDNWAGYSINAAP